MEYSNGFASSFIEQDEAYFEGLDEQAQDEQENENSSEDASDDNLPLELSNLAKFLHFELEMREYSRKVLKFRLYSENKKTLYVGRPVKECDGGKFIFAITKPETRLKKFDTADMEIQ